jgi:hypothetical protein
VSPAKPANEAAVPRAEGKGQKKAISSLRTKPEELPEIKHNCYMEWDDILMALKEYFRHHFQDLESKCPDPMLLADVPSYVLYSLPILRPEDLADLTEENDPLGIRKQTILLLYRARISQHMSKLDKQLLDKASAYRVIRSMCSPQLNAILIVDPTRTTRSLYWQLSRQSSHRGAMATSNSKGLRPYETGTR